MQPERRVRPGAYKMPDHQYFASPGVSNSDLKLIARSPAHYQWAKANPKPDSDSQIAGRALHAAILEPDVFKERYAIVPADAPNKPTISQINAKNPSAKSIEAIEWWGRFEEASQGKEIISTAKYDEWMRTGEYVRQHPELRALIDIGIKEEAVFGYDPETGMLCRAKMDLRAQTASGLVLCDLKSSEDARPKAFQRAAFNYGYFSQGALYTDIHDWAGLGTVDIFINAVFERDPPHAVKLYEIPASQLERGRAEYRKALNTYADCIASNIWPAYNTDIEVLIYPPWAKE